MCCSYDSQLLPRVRLARSLAGTWVVGHAAGFKSTSVRNRSRALPKCSQFGMHLKPILPPLRSHWAPFGLRLGVIWAPSWLHPRLTWLHLPQISTPVGPCQLHGHLTRPILAPFVPPGHETRQTIPLFVAVSLLRCVDDGGKVLQS